MRLSRLFYDESPDETFVSEEEPAVFFSPFSHCVQPPEWDTSPLADLSELLILTTVVPDGKHQ